MDSSLAGAFIDGGQRHCVLGVRLSRFTLWHLLLLQTLDSPFLRRGEVDLFALRTAVGVCRLRFPCSVVRRPWIGPLTWLRLSRRGGFEREVCAFLAFTADFLFKPEYSIRPPKLPPGFIAGPASHGPPELLRLVGDIIGWSHWSEAFVWSLPPGAAHWYRAIALRDKGADVDFMTDEDRQFNEAMKAAGKKPPKPK